MGDGQRGAARSTGLLDVLREMQDASVLPWLCVDPAWRVQSANRAFEALVGMRARQLIGQTPPYDFWSEAHPERFAAAARRRNATFLDVQHHGIAVDVEAFPVGVARARPSAFVVRARPKHDHRAADDAMWAIERLRRLETTLAKVRHELDSMPAVQAVPLPGDDALRTLSARERQVLDALLRGQRVSQVATDLGIAANTVRNHVKAIFRKVGVRSQTELLIRLRPTLDER